ncbi:hypothetical protein RhiirA1_455352 [Rhizophagus irregularis]|uniref:Uncharacterized protein n=1 Tax=Rhizophagus irregularis TaxID=588596 RepID=A0A2N0S360_9GLOM|nr:hypothetical protein RhiirA1_455352 [Rhizophagus irregularis]
MTQTQLNSILHIFNMVRIPLGDGNIVLICSKGDINNIRFIICYAAEGSSVRFYAIDGSKEAVKQPNQLTAFTNELNASNLVNRITILRRVVEKKVLKVNLPYAIHGNYGLYGSWYCENGNQLPYEPELAKLYSQDKLEYCLTCFTSSNKLKFAIIA